VSSSKLSSIRKRKFALDCGRDSLLDSSDDDEEDNEASSLPIITPSTIKSASTISKSPPNRHFKKESSRTLDITELNGGAVIDSVVGVNESLQRKFENAQTNGSIIKLLDDDDDDDGDGEEAAVTYETLLDSNDGCDDIDLRKAMVESMKEQATAGSSSRPVVVPSSTPSNRTETRRLTYDLMESSSSDETDNDDDDDDEPNIPPRNWLSIPLSYHDNVKYVESIAKDVDKALQLLLWDIGFNYKIYSHQFDAIRFVAGLVPKFPSKSDELDDDDIDDIQQMLTPDRDGQCARTSALHSAVVGPHHHKLALTTRGCLLADEMGLGKTIEALGGAALRNAMSDAKFLPTLIVTPQDGVQKQWYDTLRKAGVEPARITIIGETKKDTKERGGSINANKNSVRVGRYIIGTRYKIQSEMKKLFESTSATNSQGRYKSVLFPHVPIYLIKKLRNQYRAKQGKERNKWSSNTIKREPDMDRVTRLIRESFRSKVSLKHAFQSVIIDEAHFVKNVLAFWGMGTALLGAQSKRTMLLTGTPYNNGPADMSALMTFIDPKHKAARIGWWETATTIGSKQGVIEAVRIWRTQYMLRRTKDVLENKLPSLKRECQHVRPTPSELGIYEAYEFIFLRALDQLQKEDMSDGSPEAKLYRMELFDVMMACMSCMRMSLIHPILPGGREVTIQFSPSRAHLLKQQENKNKCVLCCETYPTQTAENFAKKKAGNVKNGDDEGKGNIKMLGLNTQVRSDMDLDDDELDDRDELDDEDGIGAMKNVKDKKKGPIVLLGPDVCQAHLSDCGHFAHEKCIEVYRGECPRCIDLSSRIHITNTASNENKVPHKVYCQQVTTSVNNANGFTASAKIEKAITWFLTSVPKNEKAIILSFFKGSLDLIEGILTDEHGINCARYDGDVDKEVRARDLQRFQTNTNYRVLLASVQSGGTGLNIVEANNICFLDRWFNPCVHDQAESRCHRLGQKRDVKVTYLDTTLTVDVVMKRVNTLKEGNASVLLADGTSLGDRFRIGHQNLSGVIGETLKAIVAMRRFLIGENTANGNADAPLSYNDTDLETKLHEAMTSRAANKKQPPKAEEKDRKVGEVEADGETESIPNIESNSEQKYSPFRLQKLSSYSPYNTLGSLSSDDSILDGSSPFHIKPERRESEVTAINKTSAASILSMSGKEDRSPFIDMDIPAQVFTKIETGERLTCSGSISSNDSILDEVIFSSTRIELKSTVKEVKPKLGDATAVNSIPRNEGNTEIIELSSDEEDDLDVVNTQAAQLKSLEKKPGPDTCICVDLA